MNNRRRKREEKERINDANVYGVTLLDIRKKHSDNRLFLCLIRAILLFLAVYGTIVGLAASFDLPFYAPVVAISLFALSLLSSFIYYNKVTFYLGYVVVFLILIIMAFAFYMYINSGFQAFINEVISRYETFFSIVSGRVAEEQITDRFLTVTVMLIFVGGVFSIFFNITISGYMDLPMTFIVSFLPLQFAFYIDIVPPTIYLVMLLSVYISVAVLGRSGRYTLPYRYKKDMPFGRSRRKNKQVHYYHASGQGMLWMMGYSVILSIVIMLIVGGVFSSDFSTKKLSNVVKDKTDKYVKTVVVSGITALFNRYDAVGGLAKGQLGGISSINPDYQADLVVTYVPDNFGDIYLKAYTGVRYERNRFYNTFKDNINYTSADDIIAADDYLPADYNNMTFSKIHIENVGADKTYDYQPYIPFITTDTGSTAKTGIAPNRSAFALSTDITQKITLDNTLSEDTYETIYLPLVYGYDYGANDPAREEEYKSLYTSYPSSLEGTLSAISNEAGLNSEEINSLQPAAKTIMIAEKLKQFYEEKFVYTYTPGSTPYNEDVVEYFLNENRKGFCAHFASSATLVLRHMGIPTRYCEGYLLEQGSLMNNNKVSDDTSGWTSGNANKGLYQIELSDANAHSWVEIYVDGYGWIPFELTPPSYETESNSGSLGFFGFFSGLFNRTERLVDDTSGDSISRSLNDNNQLTGALSEAMSDASSSGFAQFARSVGYLLLPFIWMSLALVVIILLVIIIRRLIFESKRRRYVSAEKFGDALLLEYNAALKKWKKKKIITAENPSVRDVEKALMEYLEKTETDTVEKGNANSSNKKADSSNKKATSDSNNKKAADKLSRKNKSVPSKEELPTLMDAVYCAAFSKDGIDKDTYLTCREILH
ncbi:MAG: transglutaminase-like domain-containing protein [Lachnospiraceae bacterium]|nr:transglutaminase-like domain-containing protein [Lachnospiraceae bacterium]